MKKTDKILNDTASSVKTLLLLFLIFGGLHFAKGFLIPLSIGGILATLFLPLCKWLESRKFPRSLASLTCLFVLLSVISSIGFFLGWQISEMTTDITLLEQKIIEIVETIHQYIFNKFGLSVIEQNNLFKNQQYPKIGLIYNFIESFASFFVSFMLVITYIFLLLFYRGHIKSFILKLSSGNNDHGIKQIIDGAAHISQQYLLGLFKMIVCLWVMYGVGFAIIGVKNPMTFAIICGLLEIVPFIGNITGTTITVLVSAIDGKSFVLLAGIVATYGMVQFIQGWILEPFILGPQVKINPLFTIIALVLGQIIWGISGVILAIPISAIIKIICDHIESLKPYGFLIGEIINKEKKTNRLKK